ncbi:MAG: PRC-barrel domain-containing protein [Acetobacteraceae bacterium]
MNRIQLLGAVGLAASVMAAPAFAQNTATTTAANTPTPTATTAAATPQTPGIYADVGQGGYMADQRYIQAGKGNNKTVINTNDENSRPSQRNKDLADNGSARASKVIGTDVYNTNNQKLGSVDDILIGKDSKIFAVISTNQKKVAVPFDKLEFGDALNESNDKLVLPNETQAQLNTQLEFNYDASTYQAWKANHNAANGVAATNNNVVVPANGAAPVRNTNKNPG